MANEPNEAGGAKPSYVIVRMSGGQYQTAVVSESSDPALDLYAELKRHKASVRAERNYTHAWLSVRGRALGKPLLFP